MPRMFFQAATEANVTPPQAGANNNLRYTSAIGRGKAGQVINVTYQNNGNSKPLKLTITGFDIVVQLATDASGTVTTTANDIVELIGQDYAAKALVGVICTEGDGSGTGLAVAVGQTFLGGGSVSIIGANVVVFLRDMVGITPFSVTLENTDGANATGAIATEWAPTATGPWVAIDGSEGAWPGSLSAGAVVVRSFVDKPFRFFRLKVSQGASPSSVIATVVGG